MQLFAEMWPKAGWTCTILNGRLSPLYPNRNICMPVFPCTMETCNMILFKNSTTKRLFVLWIKISRYTFDWLIHEKARSESFLGFILFCLIPSETKHFMTNHLLTWIWKLILPKPHKRRKRLKQTPWVYTSPSWLLSKSIWIFKYIFVYFIK